MWNRHGAGALWFQLMLVSQPCLFLTMVGSTGCFFLLLLLMVVFGVGGGGGVVCWWWFSQPGRVCQPRERERKRERKRQSDIFPVRRKRHMITHPPDRMSKLDHSTPSRVPVPRGEGRRWKGLVERYLSVRKFIVRFYNLYLILSFHHSILVAE